MCGRFYLVNEEEEREMRVIIEEIQERYNDKPELAAMKTGEIFPTNVVPVICNGKDLKPRPFLMKWGWAPFKKGMGPIINARSESVFNSRLFNKSIRERRCIVPATNYFEWEKPSKTKYAIRPKGESVTYMAAIYRFEEEGQTAVFSILTRNVAADIAFIHDRMPVIFSNAEMNSWLSPEADVQNLIALSLENMEYVAV